MQSDNSLKIVTTARLRKSRPHSEAAQLTGKSSYFDGCYSYLPFQVSPQQTSPPPKVKVIDYYWE